MKLIFISTDGVLTNQNYINLISSRGRNYMINLQNQIDKNKISLLNYLVSKTKAMVVLSGAWRLSSSLDKLNEMLAKSGARFTAVDTTPYLCRLENGKEADYVDELTKYLERMKRKDIPVEDFVILDDRRDFREFNNKLVRVDYERGLRPIHVERCLDLFGIQRKKEK
jgi:hypothetical protein